MSGHGLYNPQHIALAQHLRRKMARELLQVVSLLEGPGALLAFRGARLARQVRPARRSHEVGNVKKPGSREAKKPRG